jgi:hypothetical protein
MKKGRIAMHMKKGRYSFTGDPARLQSLGMHIREYFARTLKVPVTVEIVKLGASNHQKNTLTVKVSNISSEMIQSLKKEHSIELILVSEGVYRAIQFPLQALDDRMEGVLEKIPEEQRGPLCVNTSGHLLFRVHKDSPELEDYLESIRMEVTPKSSRGPGGVNKKGFIAVFNTITTENLDKWQSAIELFWDQLTSAEKRILLKRLAQKL